MLICTTNLDSMIEDAIESSEKDMDRASFGNDIQYNVIRIERDLKSLKENLDAWIARTQEKVLGHNEQYYELRLNNITQEDFENWIEEDWRIEDAKEILNHIPILFYKNSEFIIKRNRVFFDKVSFCDEFVFMGWSLGLQDEIYMDEILSKMVQKSTLSILGTMTKCVIKHF